MTPRTNPAVFDGATLEVEISLCNAAGETRIPRLDTALKSRTLFLVLTYEVEQCMIFLLPRPISKKPDISGVPPLSTPT